MPYYFTKINNYKAGKRTYTKWKRLEKASLKMENKNNLNIHLKQIITAIFLIIALI
jgi:hypothetical protein